MKIRWSGYSYYSQTGDSYKQEYDVILWDTGAISLHMITIPTTNNDGIYSLSDSSSYTYTVSVDNPDVTFMHNGEAFSIVNSMIELMLPFDVRWLVRTNEVLYTTKNNVLEELSGAMLSAECFQTNGSESPPEWELIESLVDPDILCWYDSDEFKPTIKATMTAIPFSQSIISNKVDISHSSITGIENAVADCDGELIIAVSFDDKQTWKAWNGEQWATLSEDFTGMNKETLEAITDYTKNAENFGKTARRVQNIGRLDYELAKNKPNVGFEIDGNYMLLKSEAACDFSATFQSVIGTGSLSLVEDNSEKIKGLNAIMKQTTSRSDWHYSNKMLEAVAVYRLDVDKLSCKAK